MIKDKVQTSGWRWLVWILATQFLLYQFLLQTSPSIMIGNLQQAFHATTVGVSILSASYFYTYLLLQVPAGLLVDRLGARRVLAIGMFICALAVYGFVHTQTLWIAILFRMLMGLVAAPAFGATLYLIANWFSLRQFPLVAGLTEAVGMMGAMLGQISLAYTTLHFGWQKTLWVCALLGFVGAGLIWLFVRDAPGKAPHYFSEKLSFKEIILLPLRKVFALPQVWLAGLFSGLAFAAVGAFAGFWCVPYIQECYSVTKTIAACASAMIFLGVGIGSPFLGWLSNHIGARKPVMYVGTIAGIVISLILFYWPHLPLFFTFVILFFLGMSVSVYILPFTIVREIIHNDVRATAMAFTNMLSILFGAPILQPLIGKILEMGGEHLENGIENFSLLAYQKALSVIPICFFIALLLLPFIQETYDKQATE